MRFILLTFLLTGCVNKAYLVKYYNSDTRELERVEYIQGKRPQVGVGSYKIQAGEEEVTRNGWWEVVE